MCEYCLHSVSTELFPESDLLCYQRDKKRKLCKRRATIEPIIGHLKSDFRLSRNLLKGQVGDEIMREVKSSLVVSSL
jgi:chaperone required for assembly of F1-ATPase